MITSHPKKSHLRKSHIEQAQFTKRKTSLRLLYKIFPLHYFLNLKCSGGSENEGGRKNILGKTGDVSVGLFK